VLELLVKEGGAVKTGDVIARLRSDAQQTAVARAEAGVAVAKANLAKYQEQLPQLIASAEADVRSAQAQVASASAQNNDQAALASAQAALALATANQQQAQRAYDDILKANKLGATEEQARLMLENARRSTAAAQLRFDQLKSGSLLARSNSLALAAAQAQQQAAQVNLDELTAEANGKPNPTYQAAVHQAETALQLAQAQLADTVLRAPFAGSIAQLTLKVGETVGAGSPIGVLADFSGWQIVTVDLTEVKVPLISIGQSATIILDALPDVNLKGEVQSIGQLYQEKSGDVVYPLKVKLIDLDPALRWGMTAHVTFDITSSIATAPAKSVTGQTVTTAEGRVLPAQSANLSFNVGGQVAEILITEGDMIKAGDVIARLKNDSLRATLAQAQAGVELAQAAQTNYQMQLPKLISQAGAALKAAQAKQLSASASGDNQAALLDAESALAHAKYMQQQLETALDQLYVYDRANGSRADDLRAQLQSAIDTTQAAQAQVDALKTGSFGNLANTAQIKAASAEVTAAQALLDQLNAEAGGKATDTYAAAIQVAQAALLSAQQTLAQTEIRAPFAGTVVQINLNLGEQVAADSPAIVLADLSSWRVETKDLTEIKVPLVKVGQAVIVTLDALPDVELKGTVESISGVSQLNGGDVVYPVKIDLSDSDPRLRWGMTVVVKFQ
ncbi:MAG TPA: HlyD family efflux transporter periplasmic adaptor subunit, partial [Anaerolineae bacterium]|nr:HlyD family efflux transporter periplasmic adaptor subunit [Anaerolineae bacterium]